MTSSNSTVNARMPSALNRFLRREDGAVLVEFALVMPMMIFVFAIIVEATRMMFSYEGVISGVRDATRYLARVVPANICATGGSVSSYTSQLSSIVTTKSSGGGFLPTGISVTAVTPTVTCATGTYRGGTVAVVQVQAALRITFPFNGLFALVGGSMSTISTTVTDQTRVFGA